VPDEVAKLVREALEGALFEIREDYTCALQDRRAMRKRSEDRAVGAEADQLKQGVLGLDKVDSEDPFGEW